MENLPLSAHLNWQYVKLTYPHLAAVIGSEEAWRELLVVLELVESRAATRSA